MLTSHANSLPERPLLLIVEDDALICDSLRFSLTPNFEVLTSHSRPHCLQLLGQLRRPPELALVDLGLPPFPHRPDEGFALIGDLLKASPGMRIVALSGETDDGNAHHARSLGASAFVAKPCKLGDLQQILKGTRTFPALNQGRNTGEEGSPLIGRSPAMQELRLRIRQYADLPFPVLIEGESGSGKEVIASACLHYDTRRRQLPFLALNCAAISPNLVEATLFGYARGAFTDAVTMKAGYFEDAADGTLFLDEIGELALDLQAKLLRVLENGEYQRLGETRKRISRARVVAATNRDLRKEVRACRFRSDLYHRLSVCSIVAPPLREMGDDRLLLLDHFRQHYAAQAGRQPFTLCAAAQDLWCGYRFPGNVRELRNIVIRLTSRHPGQIVGAEALAVELDLPDELPVAASTGTATSAVNVASGEGFLAAATQRLRQREPFHLDRLLDATERGYIEAALQLAHGNVSHAARLLGMHRTTLYHRMEASVREP